MKFFTSLLQNFAFSLGLESKYHNMFACLTFVIFILLSMHLFNFQRSLTYGYQISELSSIRSKINSVRQKNNIELSKLQSLDYIQTNKQLDSLTYPRSINFVDNYSKTALKY